MKFSLIGDMHLDAEPSTRVDNFETTKEEKVKEVLEIEKKEGVKLRITTGDFFNKGIVSDEKLTKIFTLWKSVNSKRTFTTETEIEKLISDVVNGEKTIEEVKKIIDENKTIPMVGVIGNHDLIGNAIESYPKTSLSFLEKSGFLTIATKENPIYIKDKDGFTVAITGSNYNHDIDGDDKSAYIVDKKLGDFHIHVVHGMLMDKSYGKKFKHTIISEVAPKTKADLTINGHDHIGYELTEINGKYFVNPGALFRLKADKSEINRKPKILILDISKNGFKVETKYLKTAKSGDLVLSREKIELKEKKEETIEEIKSIINKMGVKKGIDIIEIIENIAKTESIPENIKNNLIDLIVKKKVLLDEPYTPLGKYMITAIELENFGCYKHTYIELSEGLNGFTGESRNGKSTVLRALREIYECYMVNPRNHIRVGEDYFKITIYLDNGYVISRIVDRKIRGGRNGYEVYNPSTGQTETYNTKGIKVIQEILGYNKIKINEKNKISVNFTVQGEPWFYIGKSLSSPDRGKLAGIVYGTNYADAVLKDLNSQTKKVFSEINHYKKDISLLEKESQKYDYLSDYENRIKKSEELVDEIDKINKKIETVNNAAIEIENIKHEMKSCENIIKRISNVEETYTPLLKEIDNMIESNKIVSDLFNEINKVVNSGKILRNITNNLESISEIKKIEDEISEKQKTIEEKKNNLKNYLDLKNEIDSILTKGRNVSNLVKNLKNINEAQSLLEEILNRKENKDELEKIQKELNDINADINVQNNILEEQKVIISKNLEKYKNMLQGLTECPICRTKIDDVKIKAALDESFI